MVNSITQGLWDKIDNDKGTIFPLLHIQINEADFKNGQTIAFAIQIGVFQQRDNPNAVVGNVAPDRFFGESNEVDNMNETLGILNQLWSKMRADYLSNNFIADDSPRLVPSYESGTNLLDGWVMTFSLEVPNTSINLCQ